MITTTNPDARRLRHALADQLAAAGRLPDPRWLAAFRAVPREAFVTAFAVPGPDGLRHHDLADPDPAEAAAALRAVYTDTSLLTQTDAGGTATSSSTAPSLMALMLHQLDAQPGHHVLEIGTGTGYNAALLTHALGDDAVTSIDLDPDLVTAARAALTATGTRPTVDVADGRGGYPPRAPYDRIIATCGLDRVPAAWLAQIRPGGLILVNLSFALLLLTVTDDGTATGRFGETAAFMAMRASTDDTARTAADVLADTTHPDRHPTRQAPWHPELTTQPMAFLRALTMPTIQAVTRHTPHGPELLLTDHASGSWARARPTPCAATPVATVTEHGPRPLYDELAALATDWNQHGRPTPDRYGITVTAHGHHTLWLDTPATTITTLP